MDTFRFIPRTNAGEKPDQFDERRPCDCTKSVPCWESAHSSKWWIWTPCGHVVYLIATRVIPYQGVNEAAGLEVERIILKFARSHPHLRPGDSCTGVSGPSPAPMTPEAYPGCEWADEPKPAKPRRHDLRPNENR